MPSPHKKSFAAEQLALRQKNKVSPVVWVLIGVVVVALVVGGYVVYQRSVSEQVETKQIRSIAVIPFDNLSDDKENEYFSDGVTDDIIFRLQQIKALKVISRTSSILYKSSNKSIPEIGKELGVASILEGTVRRVGKRVKITVQLIDSQSDSHLWGKQYEQDIENIFSIQEEIAQTVVNHLKVTLLGEEKVAIEKRYTENPEAYDLYLLGREKGFTTQAIEYYEKAIEKDTNFSLAYVAIADVYYNLGKYNNSKSMINKALEIDDMIAEAYSMLANISLWHDWNWAAAEREFKRSIELNPGLANTHYFYSKYLRIMERFSDAIIDLKLAQKIDPLSVRTYAELMAIYTFLDRYDEAMEQYNKGNNIKPNHLLEYNLGRLYAKKGNYDSAIEIFKKIDRKPHLGYYYAVSGKRNQAEKLLKEVLKKSDRNYMTLAFIYAGLGETDRTFEMLENAYTNRHETLIFIKIDAEFNNLNSDPRFKTMMKKMGLPED